VENWKRNQSHYQAQLEMLNPQRTLERGYAVILSRSNEELHAVRKPAELIEKNIFQVQLAEGSAEVRFEDINITLQKS
jgi:exodeoxyribonuclease VII large subunit